MDWLQSIGTWRRLQCLNDNETFGYSLWRRVKNRGGIATSFLQVCRHVVRTASPFLQCQQRTIFIVFQLGSPVIRATLCHPLSPCDPTLHSLRSEAKMSSKCLLGPAILSALLLCSCAPPPSELSADWQNGAKRGWIVGIYGPDPASADIPICLASLSPAEQRSRQFVKFRYWHGRQTVTEVAELPRDLRVKIDDRVEAWPEDCSQGKISSISRVLAAKEALLK